MVRCTIEIVPFGIESRKQTIGLIEIANDLTGTKETGNYKIILKKTPPFTGALKQVWISALLNELKDDEDIMTGNVKGFNRVKRGPYDLLYRALKACDLDKRNK